MAKFSQQMLILFFLIPFLLHSANAASQPETWIYGIQTGVTSVNPFTLSGWDPFRASALTLEALAQLDPRTLDLLPQLATGWEVKSKSLKVHLRQGVEFHDGSHFSAEDVKFTFEAFANPRFEGAIWRPLWKGVNSVKVINPYTVEFACDKVTWSLVAGLLTQMRILPKSYYGKLNKREWTSHMVGTGPYRLDGFTSNNSLEYSYFEKWWKGKSGSPPLVRKLKLKTVLDHRLALEMIRKNQLHFFPIPDLSTYLELKKDGDPRIQLAALKGLGGSGLGIELNLENPLFKSRDVRRALLMLWNRKFVSDKLFAGQMELAIDGIDQGADNYPQGQAIPFDPQAAAGLLAKEGWKDSHHDGILERDLDGKIQKFSFSVIVERAEDERWVTLYREDAKKVGVEVTLEKFADDNQSWHRLKEKKFAAWAASNNFAKIISQGRKSDDYYNFYGYKNAKVDELLAKVDEKFSAPERQALNRQLILLVREDVPELPGLYNPNTFFALAPNVTVDPVWPYNPAYWK